MTAHTRKKYYIKDSNQLIKFWKIKDHEKYTTFMPKKSLLSSMTYGMEIWLTIKNLENKLRMSQRVMERIMACEIVSR